jgi:hypothetical protein
LDDESREENVLCPRDEQQKLKRGNKAIVIHSKTNEDCNELQMTMRQMGVKVQMLNLLKKIEWKNQLRLDQEWLN